MTRPDLDHGVSALWSRDLAADMARLAEPPHPREALRDAEAVLAERDAHDREPRLPVVLWLLPGALVGGAAWFWGLVYGVPALARWVMGIW